ncbi:MAG: hypothetical protein GY765_32750 [bacterium]|nr:hypothetical protein [bacterium]
MPKDKNPTQHDFISTADSINVDEIMTSITTRIREQKETGVLKQVEIDEIEDMELLPLPDFLEIPNVYQPHLYPGEEALQELAKEPPFEPQTPTFEPETGLVKKILSVFRKLFSSLIRFMTRPIYNDLKQVVYDKFNENGAKVHKNTHVMTLYAHYTQQMQQTKEYIKLLHNALNNMIVESSKLKIEEELLKTKLKVMEDKIEFLENRERAIEKKLFEEAGAKKHPKKPSAAKKAKASESDEPKETAAKPKAKRTAKKPTKKSDDK